MLDNCFRFAPRDSIPGLIAKICKYLKDHPGWSERELEDQIKQLIGQAGVASFNGRTGAVALNESDVNNLKIAPAYFAEGNETIDKLDLVTLYNQGVRFVFTDWNSVTSSYDLSFVLDYFSGSNNVVYYPMSTGSGGGNIVSVNGKTGIVELSLSDILGDSSAQVKLFTVNEFTSTTLTAWNSYYKDGYRVVGVVNSDASAIDRIYLLKHDENNHRPIGLSTGASDAYTPSNPPPYPVTSVNGKTGDVVITGGGEAGVISVNGKTGAVTGLYDAENPPPYPVKSVNGKTGTVTGLYDTENPPPYPVKSVNGKTGAVTGLYSAENPPPYPVKSVNGKIGVVTGLYDKQNPPPYPVTSVNGKTGAVTGLYDETNQPPYPVTSVNGKTGEVLIDFFKNSLQYSTGLVVPAGLSIIYDIPILTSGSLPKGNTIVATVHVIGPSTAGAIDPVSVIVYDKYLQATICWETDGFSITFTSKAIEGNMTNISCEVIVYSKVQFAIQSIEVN